MGFIRAALSAGLNSFNDSKFKEAVVLPNDVSSDAVAIKGQRLAKDPDGQAIKTLVFSQTVVLSLFLKATLLSWSITEPS